MVLCSVYLWPWVSICTRLWVLGHPQCSNGRPQWFSSTHKDKEGTHNGFNCLGTPNSIDNGEIST